MGPNWQQRTQQQQQQRQRDAMGAAWQQEQAAQRRAQSAMANVAQVPVDDPFLRVEAEAATIQRDLAARRISEDVARSRLEALMLQDSAGTWWMVGTRSGSWYRYDGRDWVPGARPGSAAAPAREIVTRDTGPVLAPGVGQPSRYRLGCILSYLGSLIVWSLPAVIVGSLVREYVPGSGDTEGLVAGAFVWLVLVVMSWRVHKKMAQKN